MLEAVKPEIVKGPAYPVIHTCWPVEKPSVRNEPARRVSVLVGSVDPTAGCTLMFIRPVACSFFGSATCTTFTPSTPDRGGDKRNMTLPTPQFGNGWDDGHVEFPKPVMVRVPVSSPVICTFWPTLKPALVHERPSSRVTLLV